MQQQDAVKVVVRPGQILLSSHTAARVWMRDAAVLYGSRTAVSILHGQEECDRKAQSVLNLLT